MCARFTKRNPPSFLSYSSSSLPLSSASSGLLPHFPLSLFLTSSARSHLRDRTSRLIQPAGLALSRREFLLHISSIVLGRRSRPCRRKFHRIEFALSPNEHFSGGMNEPDLRPRSGHLVSSALIFLRRAFPCRLGLARFFRLERKGPGGRPPSVEIPPLFFTKTHPCGAFPRC